MKVKYYLTWDNEKRAGIKTFYKLESVIEFYRRLKNNPNVYNIQLNSLKKKT
jgi:hypothetical protein